jgi:dolichol-phosphate mannosyltransferase
VVPCFNEEQSLPPLYERLRSAIRAVVGEEYEIVLVDDGSADATWSMIAELANRDQHVVGVRLSRNHGHQIALTAGLFVCSGDRVLIIDADLQDPPELLSPMMELLDQGADVVFGQRESRRREGWFKRATAAVFYRLLRMLSDTEIPLDTGDFRLMTRRALEALLAMPEQHRFVRGMIGWIGFRQVAMRYVRAERHGGQTHYPLGRMVRLALDAVTGFSVRPLRLASYLGLILGVLAIPMLGYTIYGWFSQAAVPGWTSVMTVVVILGSAQMVVLGVIGEYLGRVFLESKRRPLFILERLIRNGRQVVVSTPDLSEIRAFGWLSSSGQRSPPARRAWPPAEVAEGQAGDRRIDDKSGPSN